MKEPPNGFKMRFGAMSPPISAQLKEQGLRVATARMVTTYQRLADAITTLQMGGLLSEKERAKIRGRLFNKIGKDLRRA